MVSTLGSFNSLTLSLSRLPLALAEDGLSPRLFTRQLANAVPWASLTVCGIAWIAALRLSFDRLLVLDILLYGGSLILEFLALVRLRVREPKMPRPFTVPGGLRGAVLLGVGPAALLVAAAFHSRQEHMGGVSAFAVGAGIMALGVVFYLGAEWNRRRLVRS
jgi:amino acid transporter